MRMMKRTAALLLMGACAMLPLQAAAQAAVTLGYQPMALEPEAAQIPTIQNFAEKAVASGRVVVVTAHATAPDAQTAMQLAGARAQSVRGALVKLGVRAVNIKLVVMGSHLQQNEVLLELR